MMSMVSRLFVHNRTCHSYVLYIIKWLKKPRFKKTFSLRVMLKKMNVLNSEQSLIYDESIYRTYKCVVKITEPFGY